MLNSKSIKWILICKLIYWLFLTIFSKSACPHEGRARAKTTPEWFSSIRGLVAQKKKEALCWLQSNSAVDFAIIALGCYYGNHKQNQYNWASQISSIGWVLWSAHLPHICEGWGLNLSSCLPVWSLHVLMWFYSDFLPRSKNLHGRSFDMLKCPLGVSVNGSLLICTLWLVGNQSWVYPVSHQNAARARP